MNQSSALRTLLLTVAATLLAAGCADRLRREGDQLIAQGRYEEGLAKLSEAEEADSRFGVTKPEWASRRMEVVGRLVREADIARAARQLSAADGLLDRAAKINPSDERISRMREIVLRDRRLDSQLVKAKALLKRGEMEPAQTILKQILAENPDQSEARELDRGIDESQARNQFSVPSLRGLYKKPMSLEFRDAPLKMVFEVLSRTTGINFILDKDVRSDQRTTLFLKNSSLEDAVNLIAATNQIEKKILNEESVLIFPNTPQKTKDYQDLLVKTFYIGNGDAKAIGNLIKTLLKVKDLVVDEKLNLISMRDTPEAIQLVERLVATHDVEEPEVMLELEVLEVTRNKLLEAGIQFAQSATLAPLSLSGGATPSPSTTTSTGTTPASSNLTLYDVMHTSAHRTSIAFPSNALATVKANHNDETINLLANPRIRMRNKEKAKILVGERVPVVTSTSTSTGFVSGSVNYVDVGLKLEVEPTVHLNDDVAIKVGLEVSSILNSVQTNNTLAYQIGTRNASTVLRLHDGETQVLAGLINHEERNSFTRLPGLGDLPLLGRLFGSTRDSSNGNEVVLSITPRVVRNLMRPEATKNQFWSGTESVLRTQPLALPSQSVLKETRADTQPKAAPMRPPPFKRALPEKGNSSGPELAADNSPQGAVAEPTKPIAPSAAEPVMLTLEGPTHVQGGADFTVTVTIATTSPIRSMPLQIGYDADAIQVIDVAEGGFFRQGGTATNFSANADASAGKISVGVSRSGEDGATGRDTVVTLTFRATGVRPQSGISLASAAPLDPDSSPAQVSLAAPLRIAISP